ncbi:MAG: single-stranded DNA-binding protein [Candidatus Taylorbacteria bacterium RIFCSPLOWO2_12_FULL_43_20]|uniref:Single-stranded DNA-binding protein n=1 Tax=Candidatus Taylorbacteria bacterium RIFCSPLOWO2_12_FULL_43_20 TaxID=1802332 RepID=A0A1G2NZY6_9BACT|nr:MAG: single-stranded DNA-binding protein [Candidatus Taylorbacteria bacterium RIFCSPHIGHO2_01_FULL_43_120]OHA23826.1 MAG: single-stranded DNA-binding protein [Candidatus Taylorbacteria bacterium RIFCSPHIGHO2_02_FULL_43_55]OHA38673.1 MAG: single-stranded DNA-binding protein [Candidatus Taylorbacteria bacterium RIFCSPLOWO2_02_FULL_43_22b]OHA41654.1 MAG: single-stranded DNA-binding protein [Candidatus Taylorbacteria bacterium RIFCSPLOWO2_12_FULL_43_20]
MYINKAILYGNLTRDPELKSLPSGIQVASFGVATNRVYKDKDGNKKEQADFHNIVAFGRQGELAAQYLKKGSGVFVEGRMQTRSWDAQDGQKKYRTEVVADRIQFGPRSGGGGNYSGAANQESKQEEKTKPVDTIQYPEEEINPEDIPF